MPYIADGPFTYSVFPTSEMKIEVPGDHARAEILTSTVRTYALLRSIVFTTGALLKQSGADGDGVVRTIFDFEQRFYEEGLSRILAENPDMPEALRKQIEDALGRKPDQPEGTDLGSIP